MDRPAVNLPPPPLLEAPFPTGPLLTRIADLERARVRREAVLPVAGARAVFVHRALLQHDFPCLRDAALERAHPGLRRLTGERRERRIEALLGRWLAEKAALISRSQVSQTEVNSPIRTRGPRRTAHRPPDYGRALVVRVAGGALLDIKGTGMAPGRTPSFESHASGLLFLGEALREVAFGELVDAALRHAGSPCRALPVYGVLDLGFDARLPTGALLPAGILVRRAHRRPSCGGGLKAPDSKLVSLELALELLLRRYGLTSVGPMTRIELAESGPEPRQLAVLYGGTPLAFDADAQRRIRKRTGFTGERLILEGANIQFTREAETDPAVAQLVDFGSYRTRGEFTGPLVSLVSSRLLRLGGILVPRDRRYVQPHPALALPDRLLDRPDLPYRLAQSFREGEMTGEEVRRSLARVVREAVSGWV